jgi:hypothetical protein
MPTSSAPRMWSDRRTGSGVEGHDGARPPHLRDRVDAAVVGSWPHPSDRRPRCGGDRPERDVRPAVRRRNRVRDRRTPNGCCLPNGGRSCTRTRPTTSCWADPAIDAVAIPHAQWPARLGHRRRGGQARCARSRLRNADEALRWPRAARRPNLVAEPPLALPPDGPAHGRSRGVRRDRRGHGCSWNVLRAQPLPGRHPVAGSAYGVAGSRLPPAHMRFKVVVEPIQWSSRFARRSAGRSMDARLTDAVRPTLRSSVDAVETTAVGDVPPGWHRRLDPPSNPVLPHSAGDSCSTQRSSLCREGEPPSHTRSSVLCAAVRRRTDAHAGDRISVARCR